MRILHPLRRAPIALLWTGLSLSAIGDQLYAVALAWVATGLLGPAAGYLSALQAGVLLAAVLGVGRWAEQWDQQRSMIGADLARAAVLGLVVVAWLAAGGPSVAALAAAVVVLGLGQAVFQPALQVRLPALSGEPRLLPATNALLDATERSARLLGPGLVGVLGATVPMVHLFTIDALSFAASAAALVLVARLCPGRTARPVREGSWRSVVRGARAMARQPLLGFVLRVTGIVNGAWVAVFMLGLPLLIEQEGIGGVGAYGLVISAYGCTNLLSTLVFGSRAMAARPAAQMFTGTVLTGVGTALLGGAWLLPEAWRLPGCMAAAGLAAVGGPMKDIPVAVLRQTRLARDDMGAAMRATMAAQSAGTLAAMLAMPALMAWTGPAPVIVGCGMVIGAVGVAGLWRFRASGAGAGSRVRPAGERQRR